MSVVNRSGVAQVLGQVVSNCDCVKVAKLEGKRLSPGESVVLPLKLKLLVPAKASLSEPFAFETVVGVWAGPDERTLALREWTITGTVRPALRLLAPAAEFGTVSVDDPKAEASLDVLAAPGIEALKA
ncbi:MAG: hypothetical protein K2W96_27130, partial [Gemmataceae bacterium]|nr:hypothetical protein [Gemmataceae bacterium]